MKTKLLLVIPCSILILISFYGFTNPNENAMQEGCVTFRCASTKEHVTWGDRYVAQIGLRNSCDCCKEVKVSVKVKGETESSIYTVHVKDNSIEKVTELYDVSLSDLTLKIIWERPCKSMYGMEYCK